MKKIRIRGRGSLPVWNKWTRVMKLTILFLMIGLLQVSASLYSQTTKLTLNMKNSRVVEVLEEIERQSEFRFAYSSEYIDMDRKLTIRLDERNIEETLNILFDGTNIKYSVSDRHIILYPSELGKGQQKDVKGKVTNTEGQALTGVTVYVKGSTKGTTTDAGGNYSLPAVSENATLVFSFIGMETKEIEVGSQTVINIILKDDIIGIGEVVAVGYGIQKKVNVTGALSTVEGSSIIDKPVAQVSTALQGIAPGVTVTQKSGQPGQDAGTIRIRGVGTLNDNSPLVLVDGMEYNINDIDANDIESVSVLKDAAASAIYGVRAANGVILITTKRSKSSEIKVSYHGYAGIQDPTRLPDFVGAQDYMELVNLLNVNSGGSAKFTDADIAAYDDPNRNTDKYPDVFWLGEVLNGTGLQQQHSVAVSGGSERSKFRFSTNYLKQDGLVKKTNFERLTVRLNSDVNLNDRFKFSADLSAKFSTRAEPQGQGGGTWFQFMQSITANPTLPVRYSDNTWGIARGDGNPVRLQEEGGSYDYDNNLVNGNFKIDYTILDGLTISGNAMLNYFTKFYSYYNQALTYTDFFSKEETIKGSNEITKDNYKTVHSNLQLLLNYNKTFGDHYINVLGGISKVKNDTDFLEAYRNSGSLDILSEIAAGSPSSQTNDGYTYGYALLSYFGRVNYSFKDKYLFEANIRRDASSRFSEENRWGVFPSFSAGWRITSETFMESLTFIDELKLRASWGKLGNQEIGNYPYQSVMNLGYDYPFGGTLISGARMTTAANSEITWETTEMTNIGIDGILLKGKLDFSFEYYIKNTNDILLQLPIPKTVGQNAPYQNAGSVENKGWELSAGYKGTTSEDFKYEVRFNLSDVKNKITDLKDTDWEEQDNDNRILAYHVGEPIGAFYGYVCEGIFQNESEISAHATQPGVIAPGDLKYKDIENDDNSNKEISALDRQVIGSSIPRFTYGLNLSSAYKNFDLSVLFQGVGKVDVNAVQFNKAPTSQDGNFKELHMDSWASDNTDAEFPRLTTYKHNYVSSSYWIKSGSYLRLKNVQLGYTLPQPLIQTIGIERCRLYVSGQNLLTFSNLNEYGIDPENPQDSRYYPQMKIYTIGIKVDF